VHKSGCGYRDLASRIHVMSAMPAKDNDLETHLRLTLEIPASNFPAKALQIPCFRT
jgi:hypothetical protein